MPKPSNLATTYGIDIGKNGFHLAALHRDGTIVQRARLSRANVLASFATARPALVGMEACPGSQWLARKLIERGHDARIMPVQSLTAGQLRPRRLSLIVQHPAQPGRCLDHKLPGAETLVKISAGAPVEAASSELRDRWRNGIIAGGLRGREAGRVGQSRIPTQRKWERHRWGIDPR